MIFYFSGTGNSKWVAENLAGLLHEKTGDIQELIRDGEIIEKLSAVFLGQRGADNPGDFPGCFCFPWERR